MCNCKKKIISKKLLLDVFLIIKSNCIDFISYLIIIILFSKTIKTPDKLPGIFIDYELIKLNHYCLIILPL
jgi:hypothetical protein